jgi:membrane associated rhomboid family serine protease
MELQLLIRPVILVLYFWFLLSVFSMSIKRDDIIGAAVSLMAIILSLPIAFYVISTGA